MYQGQAYINVYRPIGSFVFYKIWQNSYLNEGHCPDTLIA